MKRVAWTCAILLIFSGAPAVSNAQALLQDESSTFPRGHSTPEGAASDLARAFIDRDAKLFRKICISPFGAGAARAEYEAFLKRTEQSIIDEASSAAPSPGGPKEIEKVFAARHLSREGPASYGFAAFQFQEVMFVDVGVFLQDGSRALNRTLVIKDKNGQWYVHPAPEISPLLSVGLNDEGPSVDGPGK